VAGEQDEPEAIGCRKARFLSLAVKDDQLLAKESILGDELSLGSRKVGDCGECNQMTRGLGKDSRPIAAESDDK
jgi:hypothetical protein